MKLEVLPGGPSHNYEPVAQRIIEELEVPIFLPMGKDVPYDVPSLLSVMNTRESLTILAWEGDTSGTQELVGYNLGAPYIYYPEKLKPKEKNMTPVDGGPLLPFPDDDTWIHDTIAVTPPRQGNHIGRVMLDYSLMYALEGGYTKWAVFLPRHPSSKSREMYDNHRIFRRAQANDRLIEGVVPHRGAKVTYRLYDLALAVVKPL